MIWDLEELIEHSSATRREIKGCWVPARPYIDPFKKRLKAAWMVITGEADTFVWPAGQ